MNLKTANKILEDLKNGKTIQNIVQEYRVPYSAVKEIESKLSQPVKVEEIETEVQKLTVENKLSDKMEATANAIIDKINRMIEFDMDPKEIKALADCITSIQNAFFNKQNPLVVNQVNTVLSDKEVVKFRALLKD